MSEEIEQLKAILDQEWESLAWDEDEAEGFKTVDRNEVGTSRWSTTIEVITQGPSGKLYLWEWEEGLTEMQENDRYDDSVTEVEKHEETKTIVVTTYKKVEK